jgi:hypothetical protein
MVVARRVLINAAAYGAFIACALLTGNPWFLLGLAWVSALLLLDVYLIRHPRRRHRAR